MVGGGRLPSTRRENCNGCQHIGGVIRSLTAVSVAVIACGWRTSTSLLVYGRPTLLSLVRQVDGTDSAAVRFAVVSIVRLQKGRCSADVFARFCGRSVRRKSLYLKFSGCRGAFPKAPRISPPQAHILTAGNAIMDDSRVWQVKSRH